MADELAAWMLRDRAKGIGALKDCQGGAAGYLASALSAPASHASVGIFEHGWLAAAGFVDGIFAGRSVTNE